MYTFKDYPDNTLRNMKCSIWANSLSLTIYLPCTRWHFYVSYVDYCTHTPCWPWHSLQQLFPLSQAMLISIDIYYKNANKAELTVKTENTAVGVKPARDPEISAELTAPVSHLRPVSRLWRQRPRKIQCSVWSLIQMIRNDKLSV